MFWRWVSVCALAVLLGVPGVPASTPKVTVIGQTERGIELRLNEQSFFVALDSEPLSLAAADVNGDGKTDLVVGLAGRVIILLRDGAAKFQQSAEYRAADLIPVAVAPGRFHGGGIEVAVIDSASDSIRILPADARLPAEAGASALATGDFNGDGNLDLVVANTLSNSIDVYPGRGDGTFENATRYSVGRGPRAVEVGDFNGDGKPDLAVTNSAGRSAGILLNDGAGGFGTAVNYAAKAAQAGTSLTLTSSANPSIFGRPVTLTATITPPTALGKVTFYDGTTLLGTATQSGGKAILSTTLLPAGTTSVHAYYGGAPLYAAAESPTIRQKVNTVPGTGFHEAKGSPFRTGADPSSIVAYDFNNDGIMDFAVAEDYDDSVSIFLGNGMGGFQAPARSSIGAAQDIFSLAAADFDGDGNGDLAVTGYDGVAILLGDGHGGFARKGAPIGGALPYSIAVGDFNGDGKADLAVGDHGARELRVWLGDGAGGFTQAPGGPLATGIKPAIAVGDFDGDGNADLAVTNGVDNNTVTVLLGDGSGLFAVATGSPIAVGANPVAIAAGDFNGDGRTDLTVVNVGDHTVTVLLGKGNGAFAVAKGSPLAVGREPSKVAVGDFNGDGKADLAVANIVDGDVTVLLGNGTGGFTAAVGSPFLLGLSPLSFAVADFNGDGKADMVLAGAGSGDVAVLLGDFATATSLAVTPNPSTFGQAVTLTAKTTPAAATGPVTFYAGTTVLGTAMLSGGTARLNTFILPAGFNLVHAYYGGSADYLGSGSMLIPQTVTTVPSLRFQAAGGSPLATASSPHSVAVADFNGDGKPDLAVANYGGGTVTIFQGDGSGRFTATVGIPMGAGSSPISVVAADFNGDGKADLAVADSAGSKVTILLGNGGGGFGVAPGSPFLTFASPSSLAAADFDTDGNVDLAVANQGASAFTIYHGDGTGRVGDSSGYREVHEASPYSVAVGDFNADGVPDLAVANYGNGTVAILLGLVQDSPPALAVGSNPASVATGDFNGDGVSDLAVANDGSNNVTVLLGDGMGGFTAMTGSPFAAGSNPVSVAVLDFNGDGNADLAVVNQASNNVTVLLGNGGKGFTAAPGSPFAVGTQPAFVAVGDFNRDGRADLAVANSGSNSVSILLGVGRQPQTITFAPLSNRAVTAAPFAVGATASSGLAISFSSNTSGICTVSSNTVKVVASGGCSITASQPGNGTYSAAAPVTQRFTVLFKDVSAASAYSDAVNLFAQYGITSGCGNNNYCPGQNVTRAQMAVFMIRSVFGGDNFAYSQAPHFADVAPGDFGFKWIQAMYELGITQGCSSSNGVFRYCPNDSVTRAQMAIFIMRGRLGVSVAGANPTFTYPAVPSFTDVAPGDFGFAWIQRMKKESITSGCTATRYCPSDPVTREQMAVFMVRALFNRLLPANTPLVTQVSPAMLGVGASGAFTISGVSTHFVQGTTKLSPIPGVTIGAITVHSATSLSVTLTAAANAAPQPYSILAITGSEEAVLPNGLVIQ